MRQEVSDRAMLDEAEADEMLKQAHEEHDDPIKGGIRAQMGPIQKRSIAARD